MHLHRQVHRLPEWVPVAGMLDRLLHNGVLANNIATSHAPVYYHIVDPCA